MTQTICCRCVIFYSWLVSLLLYQYFFLVSIFCLWYWPSLTWGVCAKGFLFLAKYCCGLCAPPASSQWVATETAPQKENRAPRGLLHRRTPLNVLPHPCMRTESEICEISEIFEKRLKLNEKQTFWEFKDINGRLYEICGLKC